MKKILMLCCLVLASNAWAALGDTRGAELDTADAKLNTVYKKIVASLGRDDAQKLKLAQRAWLKFRDLDCAWAYSAEPLDCMIQRTEERSSSLEETYFTDSAGGYVSVKAPKK